MFISNNSQIKLQICQERMKHLNKILCANNEVDIDVIISEINSGQYPKDTLSQF